MKKKLVVFDFDGVIIDSFAEQKRRYDFVYASFGKKSPAKTLAQWREWHDSKWERNYTRIGITGEQLRKVPGRFWRGFSYKTSKPFPGIARALARLYGRYELAIVSNTKRQIVEKDLKKRGLRKFFSLVEGGDHDSNKTQRLKNVLEKAGVEKRNAVMVGDTQTDIVAGKALGVKTLAVVYGWETRERLSKAKPDFFVAKPSGIPKAIERVFSKRA